MRVSLNFTRDHCATKGYIAMIQKSLLGLLVQFCEMTVRCLLKGIRGVQQGNLVIGCARSAEWGEGTGFEKWIFKNFAVVFRVL